MKQPQPHPAQFTRCGAASPRPPYQLADVPVLIECGLRRLRVLLADDEPIVAATLTEILTDAGCKVTTAPDGAAALQLATARRHDRFELLVTDFHMPYLNGLELAAAMRRSQPWLPVVLVTGTTELADWKDNPGGAPTRLLRKPVGGSALLAAVARMACLIAMHSPTKCALPPMAPG